MGGVMHSEAPARKRKRDELQAEEIEIDISAPEPPSKKALRKSKKAAASNDSKPTSTVKHEDNENVKRSEHGVWIGNLSFLTTKEDLRQYILDKSSVTNDMIQRIHLPLQNASKNNQRLSGDEKTQNKGFAYVDFSTAEAMNEVIRLSESLLRGRRLLIKDAKSFEGRPNASNASNVISKNPVSKRVFVGNLGFDVTKDDLVEHFGRCGKVEDIKIATFQDSGKCKGYAWVEFDTLEAGEAAVRGWVMVKDDSDDRRGGKKDLDEEQSDVSDGPEKQPKMKRCWVNRIRGRPLRMEFAEGKSVRYQKRFGKNGTGRPGVDASRTKEDDNKTQTDDDRAELPEIRGETIKPENRPTQRKTYKADSMSGVAHYKTGAIVASTGKKTVF